MSYHTYFDLNLLPDPDIPVWDRLGRVWRLLHGVGTNSKIPFAVAFPKWMENGFGLGEQLRVFCQNMADAETLYEGLEQAPHIDDLVVGTRIKRVQEAKAYEAFLMHRIPSAPSKNGALPLDIKRALQTQAKQRRLAQQTGLPFVRMRSSSGHGFRLVIERITADAAQTGAPNGYGLSRRTQIVALPIVK